MLPRIVFVDPSVEVIAALTLAFDGIPDVQFVEGPFQEVPEFDCMFSPANSFGLMDGGVDAAITAFFGDQLQKRVQARILREFFGEQPVGSALLVETASNEHPWLVHCPTMRVPMDIRGTDNVYSAFRAGLTLIRSKNASGVKIRTLACPGLGTGYGRMSPAESARQMRAAYDSHMVMPRDVTWTFAARRQNLVGVRPPNPGQIPGLTIEEWLEFDYAGYAVAKAIGLTRAPFHEYTDVLWNHASSERAFLKGLLEALVDYGSLEVKSSPEGDVFRSRERS